MKHLTTNADALPHPFGRVQRLLLIHTILKYDCCINLDRCGEVIAHFPLSDSSQCNDLIDNWTSLDTRIRPWASQPLNEINAYLGSQIAFYFSLLGHISGWVLVLQVLHVIPFLHSLLIKSEIHSNFNLWYSAIVSPLW